MLQPLTVKKHPSHICNSMNDEVITVSLLSLGKISFQETLTSEVVKNRDTGQRLLLNTRMRKGRFLKFVRPKRGSVPIGHLVFLSYASSPKVANSNMVECLQRSNGVAKTNIESRVTLVEGSGGCISVV